MEMDRESQPALSVAVRVCDLGYAGLWRYVASLGRACGDNHHIGSFVGWYRRNHVDVGQRRDTHGDRDGWRGDSCRWSGAIL
jgi:hypothetical protein